MTDIIRRQALCKIGGGSVAALLLGSGSVAAGASAAGSSAPGTTSGAGGVLVQGKLTLNHAQGRRMTGFIETGIDGGITLCSLVRQHAGNPAIESIFAEPERRGRIVGVRVTVSLYNAPAGDVDFSLLHLPADPSPVAVA